MPDEEIQALGCRLLLAGPMSSQPACDARGTRCAVRASRRVSKQVAASAMTPETHQEQLSHHSDLSSGALERRSEKRCNELSMSGTCLSEPWWSFETPCSFTFLSRLVRHTPRRAPPDCVLQSEQSVPKDHFYVIMTKRAIRALSAEDMTATNDCAISGELLGCESCTR